MDESLCQEMDRMRQAICNATKGLTNPYLDGLPIFALKTRTTLSSTTALYLNDFATKFYFLSDIPLHVVKVEGNPLQILVQPAALKDKYGKDTRGYFDFQHVGSNWMKPFHVESVDMIEPLSV